MIYEKALRESILVEHTEREVVCILSENNAPYSRDAYLSALLMPALPENPLSTWLTSLSSNSST